MTGEAEFIDHLRHIATHPAARGLNDDTAVLPLADQTLIITHDMMVEGVHWLPNADPADVAWKLVAVNLSDLAAKGAVPLGVVLGFALAGDNDWDARFAAGLETVLAEYDVPLLGGDTVSVPADKTARALGLTALGRATCDTVPSRSGAKAGNKLYVTGAVGDARAGFLLAQSGGAGDPALLTAFHRPAPLLEQGQTLAGQVHAMMDVSDGLLLDAARMTEASGLALTIDLHAVPLSQAYIAQHGDDAEARLAAARWGDDYQLLFALPQNEKPAIAATPIGQFTDGSELSLRYGNKPYPLPEKLGYLHR
ncbi:thiamine-phosphate kinase [Alterisphingorhabdus coralli]|uniref:Thiamine-monophosphate kinase n=1 Tax=Alterisphingorhabdus coralli TaxID=3071408 RepID=A0AA97F8I9_9SPHN|nr:thiamine-phosphate kinase [Parasphingorhabdus sp. SCSIO 66989]WOE75886.1 thiamine-phosphate kinase [Parasphingorhabdus sp. SCSIO 66989]